MILITGATGNLGQELAKLLAQSKISARAMCQHKEDMTSFTAMGLEAVVGDFNDPVSLRKAMLGCERLFLVTPAIREQSVLLRLAIDMAIETRIRHIVKISAGDTNLDSRIAWAKAHAEGDHYLRSKPVAWTVLRATGFMINILESRKMIATGILPNPTEQGKVSWIDHRDISLVAKHVLTEDVHKHQRATYFLTGPEALSTNDVAGKLTHTLGYPVKSTPATLEDMRKALLHAGLDEWRIDSIIAQFEMVKGAHAVDVTEEVERITGYKPRTFQQFLEEFKDRFAVQLP